MVHYFIHTNVFLLVWIAHISLFVFIAWYSAVTVCQIMPDCHCGDPCGVIKSSCSWIVPANVSTGVATTWKQSKRAVARKSTAPTEAKHPKVLNCLVAEDASSGNVEGWEPPWVHKMKCRQFRLNQQKLHQDLRDIGLEHIYYYYFSSLIFSMWFNRCYVLCVAVFWLSMWFNRCYVLCVAVFWLSMWFNRCYVLCVAVYVIQPLLCMCGCLLAVYVIQPLLCMCGCLLAVYVIQPLLCSMCGCLLAVYVIQPLLCMCGCLLAKVLF